MRALAEALCVLAMRDEEGVTDPDTGLEICLSAPSGLCSLMYQSADRRDATRPWSGPDPYWTWAIYGTYWSRQSGPEATEVGEGWAESYRDALTAIGARLNQIKADDAKQAALEDALSNECEPCWQAAQRGEPTDHDTHRLATSPSAP